MSTCPFCSAETRPGDNFCLSCGNRLPATPSPQQAQPKLGDSPLPGQDPWSPPQREDTPLSNNRWSDLTELETAESTYEMRPQAADSPPLYSPATQKSAKLVLRTDTGDILQEYPLDKEEISIGRAPNSDILLSKDKLTSRRHATVRLEDGLYFLRDERSANGTFVNGQQLDEMKSHVLKEGDRVGIGEHELIFHFITSTPTAVEDMPTISVPFHAVGQDATYTTQEDELATSLGQTDFSTRSMENGAAAAMQMEPVPVALLAEEVPSTPPVAQTANVGSTPSPEPAPAPTPAPIPLKQSTREPASSNGAPSDSAVTFRRLSSIAQPSLPDIAPLLAAISSLDGQVMSLQEQLQATQQAMGEHEATIAETANQLRTGVRRVSDRMDGTIADVARRREEVAWADLLQIMEDVENNPRDIEYVTKLARKARELKKVFQMHQNVLSTLAECNSLLRTLLGEER